MDKHFKYASTDKMSDLICGNYNLLLVMSRFGLSLGFGDQTVEQVCDQQGRACGIAFATSPQQKIRRPKNQKHSA